MRRVHIPSCPIVNSQDPHALFKVDVGFSDQAENTVGACPNFEFFTNARSRFCTYFKCHELKQDFKACGSSGIKLYDIWNSFDKGLVTIRWILTKKSIHAQNQLGRRVGTRQRLGFANINTMPFWGICALHPTLAHQRHALGTSGELRFGLRPAPSAAAGCNILPPLAVM